VTLYDEMNEDLQPLATMPRDRYVFVFNEDFKNGSDYYWTHFQMLNVLGNPKGWTENEDLVKRYEKYQNAIATVRRES